jgi:hypothetical protein
VVQAALVELVAGLDVEAVRTEETYDSLVRSAQLAVSAELRLMFTAATI